MFVQIFLLMLLFISMFPSLSHKLDRIICLPSFKLIQSINWINWTKIHSFIFHVVHLFLYGLVAYSFHVFLHFPRLILNKYYYIITIYIDSWRAANFPANDFLNIPNKLKWSWSWWGKRRDSRLSHDRQSYKWHEWQM